MKRFLKVLTLFLFFVLTLPVHAQIRYDGTTLTLGPGQYYPPMAPYPSYEFRALDYKGLYWQNGTTFLKIDMKDGIKFSGSNGFIDFYYTATQAYQAVKCYNFMARGSVIDSLGVTLSLRTSPTERLNSLNPVSYKWKDGVQMAKSVASDNTEEIGLIAQEVEAIFPELVSTDDDGHKLVNYLGLLPLLYSTLEQLNEIADRQAAEIEVLKSLIKE